MGTLWFDVLQCSALGEAYGLINFFMLKRVVGNWHKARVEMVKWRAELKKDGEYNMLITSYVYAPLYWFLALIICVIAAVTQKDTLTT